MDIITIYLIVFFLILGLSLIVPIIVISIIGIIQIHTFLQETRKIAPELNIPNGFTCSLAYLNLMCDRHNIKRWLRNVQIQKNIYETEAYSQLYEQTKQYMIENNELDPELPSKIMVGPPVLEVISPRSRISAIPLPLNIQTETDETLEDKRDKIRTELLREQNKFANKTELIKFVREIENEMLENNQLDTSLRMEPDEIISEWFGHDFYYHNPAAKIKLNSAKAKEIHEYLLEKQKNFLFKKFFKK
jgi:hypothetical protein